RLDRRGNQDRGEESHLGTERRVYEDAEQAAASEPGSLGQVHERRRERLALPGEGASRWAAEIEAGRLDGLHHDGTRECVERRGLMGRERLASAGAPERLPQRSPTPPHP